MTIPENKTQPLVELQEVEFGYRKKVLLSKVNLSIDSGEKVAIIGDNGSGKSTLLNILMGLLKPKAGKRSQNISNSKISYVEQRPTKNFIMPIKVEEFIKLGLIGLKNINLQQRVCEVLEQVNMLDRLQDNASILSGGQFQRVVLARAMARNPEMMYLDEPTTGLDRKSSREFIQELDRLCKNQNITTAMVLHNFRLLDEHFSHVIWIHEGLAQKDTVDNWMQNHRFLEFIGRTPA